MRPLRPAPTSAYDENTGAFAFGSYRGRIARAELDRERVSRLRRRITQKKWVYIALITDELVAAFAIVHLGYASKRFYYVLDRESGAVLGEGSDLGGPLGCRVHPVGSDAPERVARFGESTIERSPTRMCVTASLRGFSVRAEAQQAMPEMTAIARIPDGVVNVTEKGVLMPLSGSLAVGDRTFDLAGGHLGYDHTSGLMARHTSWRWAFAMGKDVAGEPFAMNLVSGFVGELECTAWTGGEPHALAEPVIHVGDAQTPWRIESADTKLHADERARHEELTNLRVIRSRFIQATGTFRGRITADGREIDLLGVPGMIEDQDVLW